VELSNQLQLRGVFRLLSPLVGMRMRREGPVHQARLQH
jgi:hypothetical protein